MSKRDDQILDVIGTRGLSTFAITHLIFGSTTTTKERQAAIEDHLEDMHRRDVIEKRRDPVASWRTLWSRHDEEKQTKTED